MKDIKLVLPILNVTAPLGQRKNQQNQNARQHGLSFGSLTVPLDRNVANQFGAFGTGLVGSQLNSRVEFAMGSEA